jgi:hypothetical protein
MALLANDCQWEHEMGGRIAVYPIALMPATAPSSGFKRLHGDVSQA